MMNALIRFYARLLIQDIKGLSRHYKHNLYSIRSYTQDKFQVE